MTRAKDFGLRPLDYKDSGRQGRHEAKEGREMEKVKYRLRKWAVRMTYVGGVLAIALPARAFAAVAGGGVLLWDQPLTTLQADLQGPLAHAVTTAAIIGTAITWSVSWYGTGVRKMSALAFGGAAALGATTLMTALFPAAGALFWSARSCR
jgi:type IV secretory pathway VirB2 component (pilin)